MTMTTGRHSTRQLSHTEYCELTDLIESSCAHCRGLDHVQVATLDDEDPFWSPGTVRRIVRAENRSEHCPAGCGEPIEAGAETQLDPRIGFYVHRACVGQTFDAFDDRDQDF